MTYKRDDKQFKAQLAKIADSPLANTQVAGRFQKATSTVKPFRKHDDKIVTATIDENGDVLFLATDANDLFLNHGTVVTKRASHIEPANWGYRVAFRILRLFGDKNKIAQWTREWPVVWRINTSPIGGPIVRWKDLPHNQGSQVYWGQDEIALWLDRQEAIDFEVIFVNNLFLERRIQ